MNVELDDEDDSPPPLLLPTAEEPAPRLDLLAVLDELLEALLLEAAFVVPLADTVCPTSPDSETIVPSCGAYSFVFSTACSSLLTVSLSVLTLALADARFASRVAVLCVAFELLPPVDVELLDSLLPLGAEEPLEVVVLVGAVVVVFVVVGAVVAGVVVVLAGVVVAGVVVSGVVVAGVGVVLAGVVAAGAVLVPAGAVACAAGAAAALATAGTCESSAACETSAADAVAPLAELAPVPLCPELLSPSFSSSSVRLASAD